ncbi:SDR family NAD(P)-dependent oxidoreductase [Microbacterium sp. EF45047]|uniref:SDR family NAD(P)-dependent oxidoreductase n=1 Tax=Microbacterium sp. EF45047 TaxID=2809708 RepID=UPI00234A6378|nr:SDR family oxidoreductase [Microbacterium sp. EF45047]WCM55949.1 SDR family oxidoreductase [Microbacterium sp. EF45047]
MTESTTLSGRVAVVVGGARGLGLAMAAALADYGADVALLDILPAVSDAAAALAAEKGVRTFGHRIDVTEPASVQAAFEAARSALGTATALVNAAGIAHWGPALEVTREQWQRVIDVNLTGTFLCAQEFARRAVAAEAPATIVNISSMSGTVVNVPQQQVAYNVSKAGVSMLTKSLAIEWLPLGVRVNAIAPGYFASDMTKDAVANDPTMADEWMRRIPAGRMGEPHELGELVVYLSSDASRYVVGQSILIDGGYTLV